MADTSLYSDILDLIKDEAELDKYTALSLDTVQELYTDFPPVSVTATPQLQNGENQQDRAVTTTPTPPRTQQIPTPKTQEPEATPIAPANIDLSTVTADSLNNGKIGASPIYTGEHFTISGEGNTTTELMFIGEAQGRGKDQINGEPSQLLTKMIDAMKFSRETVFIADICHSVPIDNPQTIDQELGVCVSYLKKQIEVIKPKIIVFLGPLPLRLLLNMRGISKHRGQWLEFMGAKVMPTFHPALLLREPQKKRETWEDLQAVMKELSHTP